MREEQRYAWEGCVNAVRGNEWNKWEKNEEVEWMSFSEELNTFFPQFQYLHPADRLFL